MFGVTIYHGISVRRLLFAVLSFLLLLLLLSFVRLFVFVVVVVVAEVRKCGVVETFFS